MDWEEAEKAGAIIVLHSVVKWINELKTFDDEEKERLINVMFNVLTNSFKPDMALYFNEAILKTAETLKENREDMMKVILSQLNWDK